ncbi:MAG: acyl-CoA dehydrogenase family protein [Gammaproteobacteria bacterium]
MRFYFSDEQEQFRDIVRKFFDDKVSSAKVREDMSSPDGADPELWASMSQDLGLTGVHIPEIYGGGGFGYSELAIALEEMGRCLSCSPYFATTALAATSILLSANEEQKQQLLPALANGQQTATLATTEPNGQWQTEAIKTTATQKGGIYVLNGIKKFVIDGQTANTIVVSAREAVSKTQDVVSLFYVQDETPGVTRKSLASIDQTRRLSQLEFHNAHAERLGEVDASKYLNASLDIATIGVANEMVGGAQKLLEDAVEYAQLRIQFGRPIGSFQAIKHQCADLLLAVELAKAAAYYASAAADENDPELPMLASLAKALASDTYMKTATQCLQIHGGIGFTWDHDVHLWFKRAKASQVYLGDANYHRERYVRLKELTHV